METRRRPRTRESLRLRLWSLLPRKEPRLQQATGVAMRRQKKNSRQGKKKKKKEKAKDTTGETAQDEEEEDEDEDEQAEAAEEDAPEGDKTEGPPAEEVQPLGPWMFFCKEHAVHLAGMKFDTR